VFWVAAMAALQRMGKADPLLRHTYLRHIRYRSFYPAKSGLHSQTLSTPLNWR
jgi:type IV secretion system protein VirB3